MSIVIDPETVFDPLAQIRWDVVGGDASQGLLSLTDSSGAVRSFELTWSSSGPWDFISLKSDGEVIKLRRNR